MVFKRVMFFGLLGSIALFNWAYAASPNCSVAGVYSDLVPKAGEEKTMKYQIPEREVADANSCGSLAAKVYFKLRAVKDRMFTLIWRYKGEPSYVGGVSRGSAPKGRCLVKAHATSHNAQVLYLFGTLHYVSESDSMSACFEHARRYLRQEVPSEDAVITSVKAYYYDGTVRFDTKLKAE
jgi:hypothetical protein